ncbi:MAG TPA: SDR family NAD(P)-dependent oxidoreductase, partial [bacterium]|nr:SDR family NAD(P)-dependent oxidoreductase [bacterium]
MSLAERVALVTGASGGIGSAIAVRLAREGAGIVVHYHQNTGAAERTRKRVEETGGSAKVLQADITSADECRRAIDAAGEWRGRLDIVINNSGLTRDGLLIRMRDEDWHDIMAINLHAAFYLTRAC